jgi:hypothetical protein
LAKLTVLVTLPRTWALDCIDRAIDDLLRFAAHAGDKEANGQADAIRSEHWP